MQHRDCGVVYALSAILRHPAACSDLKRLAGPEAFQDEARTLAAAICSGRWSGVESALSKTKRPSRMGKLLAVVERSSVPGNDEAWAIHLVRCQIRRESSAIAAAQFRWMADRVEARVWEGPGGSRRMLKYARQVVDLLEGKLKNE